MTTQVNWIQLCQTVGNGANAVEAYGPVSTGSQVSVTAAVAWNPVAAAGNAIVDAFIVPQSGSEVDATHVERISVPPGSALSLTNLINQKLTGGMSLWIITNGATVTVSGAIAS